MATKTLTNFATGTTVLVIIAVVLYGYKPVEQPTYTQARATKGGGHANI